MQHPRIAHPSGHRFHQFGVRNAVEVSVQIRVDYFPMPRVQQRMDGSNSIQGAAITTVGILLRLLPAGATAAGWDSHPLKIAAFSRRTDETGLDRARATRSWRPIQAFFRVAAAFITISRRAA
jgi:hypothetical protein